MGSGNPVVAAGALALSARAVAREDPGGVQADDTESVSEDVLAGGVEDVVMMNSALAAFAACMAPAVDDGWHLTAS